MGLAEHPVALTLTDNVDLFWGLETKPLHGWSGVGLIFFELRREDCAELLDFSPGVPDQNLCTVLAYVF
jgi:hypothetical protein